MKTTFLHNKTHKLIWVIVIGIVSIQCGTHKQLKQLRENNISTELLLTKDGENYSNCRPPELSKENNIENDTLIVQSPEGKDVIIMKAVKDDNGEMVATDVINAAVVTARFRNIAERNGMVELRFNITVPSEMRNNKWQLRLQPMMDILGKELRDNSYKNKLIEGSIELEPIIITGRSYRKMQLKGYEQYYKFLDSILADENRIIDIKQLEVFIERNIPNLYKFKTDSSYVSNEKFISEYGVTEKLAIEHYKRKHVIKRWKKKKMNKRKMFRKYVKSPIEKEGLRLDTVLVDHEGNFEYSYVQTVKTRPRISKINIQLKGEILEDGENIYTVPKSESITFYISSLSSFANNKTKYISRVIERRATANTACYINFDVAKWNINPELDGNFNEIGRIKMNLRELAENKIYDLDSIIVTASCSPEGRVDYNRNLSQKRAESVSEYFSNYLKQVQDSLNRIEHYHIELGSTSSNGLKADELKTNGLKTIAEYKTELGIGDSIKFISKSNPENWSMLNSLIEIDDSLSRQDKKRYKKVCRQDNLDSREALLAKESFYLYLRTKLYPRLRTVKFNFFLHRKGMVKDTIHTTEIDSVYMSGLLALKNHDYKNAITLLKGYKDFNSAIAYCAMNYNATAMEILETLKPTEKVNYMLAILYSRIGDDKNAVEKFLKACSQNRDYINRGNLDPEISYLIDKYNLEQHWSH